MLDPNRCLPIALSGALLAAGLLSCGPREDPDLEFHRGLNALDEGRSDQARIHFAKHLEQHPEQPQTWRLAGIAWLSGTLQSATRAADYWRRYLELRPDDVEVALGLTRALQFLGEWDQARAWCARLDDSADSQAQRARVLLDSDPRLAERAIAAAIDAEGDNPRHHATAAEVYQALDDLERARDHAARAIRLDPLDLRSTYLAARLHQRLDNPADAAELFATHQLLGRMTGAGSTRQPEAAAALRLLRELEPRVNAQALPLRFEKLRLLVAGGRHGEARAVLGGLAASEPMAPALRLELVGLADQLGELAAARNLLEGVLADAPAGDEGADHGGNRREALYGLALLARREGDPARARELAEDALEQFPNAARFHHLLGRLELTAGKATAAGRFEQALELAPWNAECRIDLANMWLSEGRLEEVSALLQQAPGPDPAIDRYRRQHDL